MKEGDTVYWMNMSAVNPASAVSESTIVEWYYYEGLAVIATWGERHTVLKADLFATYEEAATKRVEHIDLEIERLNAIREGLV